MGRVYVYLDDISCRYLGSIYRSNTLSIGDRYPMGNRAFTSRAPWSLTGLDAAAVPDVLLGTWQA